MGKIPWRIQMRMIVQVLTCEEFVVDRDRGSTGTKLLAGIVAGQV